MQNIYFTFLLSLLISFSAFSQIDGDNIFSEDQVVTIELDFYDANFYSTLVSEYQGEQNYILADLTLTDITGIYEIDSVGIRLKGNSSYSHPGQKKSFKIDFNKFVSGKQYDGLKKLNFSNNFKDPAVIREKVFFDVARSAGVPAPRTSFANVLFNGEAWGFYTIVEQIDDQFLDWKIEEDDGNLFKAGSNFGGGGGGGGGGSAADLLYYGDDQSAYEDRYELKSNEDKNDWSDLIRFIDFINNSSDSDFEASLADSLELIDFLRSVALDNLFANMDSYTESARNYYIYHNLDTKKWEWIKWDGNESFGRYPVPGTNVLNLPLDYHSTSRPLLARIFENDAFYLLYLEQVCDITEKYFNVAYMNTRIDALKVLVQDHVYADNNKMYSNNDFDTNIESNLGGGGGGGGGGTTYGLKSFVSDRSAYITSNLDCSVFTAVNYLEERKLTIYPNPSDGQFEVIWEDENISHIDMYDIAGKRTATVLLNKENRTSINTTLPEPGLYFLTIHSKSGKTTTSKIIIE